MKNMTCGNLACDPSATLPKVAWLVFSGCLTLASAASPESFSSTNPIVRLPDVVVTAEDSNSPPLHQPYLPEVVGTKILAGKKTTLVDFEATPAPQTDNYRQAFAKTPGLLVSELANPSLLSLGSRGIGDPHETQNLLVLKDGIPFVADLFGYPTVYYAPPFESLDRMEFYRGGASLLYGPQPAGALNYVTHMPRTNRPGAVTIQQIAGSDHLLATYASFDGTVGRLGYHGYFSRRAGESFRDLNSDYEALGGSLKLVMHTSAENRWIFNMDAFRADSGEPGGLTLATAPGALNYHANRHATQTPFDRVRVERYMPSLTLERDFTENTLMTATAYGGYFGRFSKRQQGTGFGLLPSGPTADNNLIQLQQFYTFGTDLRLRHHWTAMGEEHTFTGGFSTYYSHSPFTVRRGNTPDAEVGELRQQVRRQSVYGAFFVENCFRFHRLSITPAFRLENLHQNIKELANLGTGEIPTPKVTLAQDAYVESVPLVGLGVAYDLGARVEAYGNVSQGYKAKMYTDAVPLGVTDTISANLEPGKTWTYEVGLRGAPRPWLTFDTSLFLVDYNDRFGRVGNHLQNVGRSINQGWDAAVELDLLGLYADQASSPQNRKLGSFSLYGNVELLHARFVSGPANGRTPQYAPDYLLRAGAIYRWKDRVKLALMGTFLDDHFGDDANTAAYHIPGYLVWDLTGEFKVYRDRLRLLAGINNLFDEDYYSRIRGNGVDPAYGRNYYVGLSLGF
ncbi:TonB-dependent receptor [Fontisphaera persica]|uniref:TonB-dependent receptor family protein n=1 Tax=Fontisphaera persica TaxID=2974023 RepID=UPI0024C05E43|nr:TonB-dependent receptor plug domain-containing protein [Fontisphaera persica]WCJ58166.1 TonB-dependent receptor [Fontisphaera persica]